MIFLIVESFELVESYVIHIDIITGINQVVSRFEKPL